MNGIINVLKPSQMTSHDVVSFIRKRFNMKKVGHTGTLDPNAAGVLPICIGNATRVAEYFNDFDKSYRAELTLGESTDTQDKYGETIATCEKTVTKEQIEAVFESFRGDLKQTPPMFSALKQDGKKLYELARAGKVVERKQRDITVYDINILKNYDNRRILFDVDCSKGTYIRTICNDIGEQLGTLGHTSFLMRTRVGEFDIKNAYTLNEIDELKEQDNLISMLMPLDTALMQYKKVDFDKRHFKHLTNGMKFKLTGDYKDGEALRVYCSDQFIGVGEVKDTDDGLYLKTKKVLI